MASSFDQVHPPQNLRRVFQRHSDFILLLILFVTFRVLALAAYRPGGLVLDFSDFYWYREYAQVTRQGYYPYYNLWTTYPPLFPSVMIAIYQLSTLLPPWEFHNLWFTLLLGSFFLLFEIGIFVLIYLLALKLYPPPNEVESGRSAALRPCWIYAALFVPVYTLTGHFESYPIFFFLLGLYLLLQKRPYLSAFFTGIGFMIKLIPLLLVPVAAQIFSRVKYLLQITNRKLQITSLSANENSFTIHHSPFIIPFDLPRLVIYLAILLITVIIIATPFYLMNPKLIWGPFQISSARQPWETVWALIDGNYDYGAPPLDRRDLTWSAAPVPTHIPWLPVTAMFGLIYVYFYTRPLDWHQSRNVLAFTGFSLSLFMLWSKGYSPQWLGWPLVFVVLLLPNLRGVLYASILNIANIIEGNFFFIIFPEERWLLAATVLIRTFLLLVLAVEFLLLIWPQTVTPRVEKIRTWGLATFVTLLFIGTIPAALQLGHNYFDLRLRQSPYSATITRLQGEPVQGALLLNSHSVYDWFYPYLRHDYAFFMLDDYAPPGETVTARTATLLDNIASQTDVLWIYDADATVITPAEAALDAWLGDTPLAHIQDIDGGRLYLYILKSE
ncbi:MAG: hypothetical protein JXM69_01170 [Anaerolineae bacterium]|nr:hypothetical protein [Anaerolineae bacterium]